jgi:pilus assembly protein CpaF
MEGPLITMQEIFRFKVTGRTEAGDVTGYFEATGVRPKFLRAASEAGLEVPGDYFRPDVQLGQV